LIRGGQHDIGIGGWLFLFYAPQVKIVVVILKSVKVLFAFDGQGLQGDDLILLA
jgi:hypothetical protein